ncbi:hypothetical protein IFM89_023606 [Coptis chinensis]|uniref:Uncharacterized protein n=1 Tax=Coptis chinensis TaxID=261450 RepID=A0A835H7H4_9MAGN|nr:hypothetical protein IFM89_023606 [Coptis chinensis]
MGMGKRYLLGMGGIGRGIGKNAERDVKVVQYRGVFEDIGIHTHLKTVKPTLKGKNPVTLDHPTVRAADSLLHSPPTKINLETFLVEETPRVKPKKPTTGRPMGTGRLWPWARAGAGGGGR